MCAPIILSNAVIGLAAAHFLGIGLMAGLIVFNSNGARKGMCSLLGFGEGNDSPVNRVISMMSR
jgi:hypothetical protein